MVTDPMQPEPDQGLTALLARLLPQGLAGSLFTIAVCTALAAAGAYLLLIQLDRAVREGLL